MSDLSIGRLRDVLHYDPATGIWTWLQTLAPRGQAGSRAGCVSTSGYRRLRIDGKHYRSSRLAFFYMTGRWPDSHIDHENLNKQDDRWSNLREATGSQNNGNWARLSTNKSGHKGVSWAAQNGKWVAYIQVGGKNRNLGYFASKSDAAQAYARAAVQAFGEFARVA